MPSSMVHTHKCPSVSKTQVAKPSWHPWHFSASKRCSRRWSSASWDRRAATVSPGTHIDTVSRFLLLLDPLQRARLRVFLAKASKTTEACVQSSGMWVAAAFRQRAEGLTSQLKEKIALAFHASSQTAPKNARQNFHGYHE